MVNVRRLAILHCNSNWKEAQENFKIQGQGGFFEKLTSFLSLQLSIGLNLGEGCRSLFISNDASFSVAWDEYWAW